ncbi:winged helix-turn-helix transcriptional regulator [Nocardia sp. NPDC055321]
MTRRSYDQYCGLAGALDVVGERWSLLVVRELMSGPKRYSDLAATLDGIGTSMLATRLRLLEADGVVSRRHLPPPAASLVYELTPAGWELAEAMTPLAMWGVRHRLSDTRPPGQTSRAEWGLVFLAGMLDRGELAGAHATIEFHVDDSVAQLHLRDGQANVEPGPAVQPADATVTTDVVTLAAIGAGRVSALDAMAEGGVSFEGDPAVLQRLLTAMPAPLVDTAPPTSNDR